MATKPVTIRQLREMTLALLPDIFGECLMDEETRFSLSAPFLRDGQVVAANGHILVMRPASPGLAELLALMPGRKTPDVKSFKRPDWTAVRPHTETTRGEGVPAPRAARQAHHVQLVRRDQGICDADDAP
jgi:hypothetical protein